MNHRIRAIFRINVYVYTYMYACTHVHCTCTTVCKKNVHVQLYMYIINNTWITLRRRRSVHGCIRGRKRGGDVRRRGCWLGAPSIVWAFLLWLVIHRNYKHSIITCTCTYMYTCKIHVHVNVYTIYNCTCACTRQRKPRF